MMKLYNKSANLTRVASTPQPYAKKLSEHLGVNVFFKREDLHPFGSHKGRSIPLMIKRYAKQGWRNFVISSSGNAALAAVHAINEYNKQHQNDKLSLTIFVGNNIDKNKILELRKLLHVTRYTLHEVSNPKQQAFQMEKSGQAKNLRQSTDDMALVGYEELAKELADLENLAAVFIPTSSGATAQGLHEGFSKLGLNPQIHIVQTDECHPMTENRKSPPEADPPLAEKVKSQKSLANAIVDQVAHRKEKIQKIIKTSQGNGWIATNDEIISAMRLVKKTEDIEVSPNSALSIVGLMKAIKEGWKFAGAVVCLITGK